ncbi:MAG: 4Fe-4S dicluster domain-containing protein [Spirochaetaceae bacterium]|jgi:electron transport complex protein RnfC|nr:4Fe-4S dicluster domain-containing protein [Spirochaetaceae bacterium]
MKVYSFSKGGIQFEDGFAPRQEHSRLAFLPETVIMPLSTEAGCRSYPVVLPGQHIEEGVLIARGQGAGSANIHSPIPGKLVKTIKWGTESGVVSDALVIRLEGSFSRLGKSKTANEWTGLSGFEIRSLLAEYGVIEMEGLGRPLCDILSALEPTREPLTLAVRCVFDDPWLAADYCLCNENPDEVVEGGLIAARAAGASAMIFAVSAAEKRLGEILTDAAKRNEAAGRLAVASVTAGSRYPQHSDYEMNAILSRHAKNEGLAKGRFLILSPATLAAVYEAVVMRAPVLERYIAVGGPAVKRPAVLKARIGSRLRNLFAECGGFRRKTNDAGGSEPDFAVIGSPLLGRAAVLDEPVLKTSRAVFAPAMKSDKGVLKSLLRLKSARKFMPMAVCINCGECRSVCPAKLDPEHLYKRIKTGKHSDSLLQMVSGCIGCGCCEAVCPSKLPLCAAIARFTFKGAARAV